MKLVIFDVDNTIVKGQSQRLLLKYLFDTKKVSFYYYVSVLVWFIAYKLQIARDPRKVISFAYCFLKGKTVGEMGVMMSDFFDTVLSKNIFPDALLAVRNLEREDSNENEVILVSNAPSFIIKPLASALGVKTFFCTQLELVDGLYTGKVSGDIMYGDNKKKAVNQFATEKGYVLNDAMAYGDHISDLPILDIVGRPVAINPSSALRKIALKKGWEIHNWNL
jgi:HAD superfamily hydrolase (TIGR01490 family)